MSGERGNVVRTSDDRCRMIIMISILIIGWDVYCNDIVMIIISILYVRLELMIFFWWLCIYIYIIILIEMFIVMILCYIMFIGVCWIDIINTGWWCLQDHHHGMILRVMKWCWWSVHRQPMDAPQVISDNENVTATLGGVSRCFKFGLLIAA